MAMLKKKETDRYADYRYKIVMPEELREAKYLISLGLFKNMEHYIECTTAAEIRIMKREEAKKKKYTETRKKKIVETKETRKAA